MNNYFYLLPTNVYDYILILITTLLLIVVVGLYFDFIHTFLSIILCMCIYTIDLPNIIKTYIVSLNNIKDTQ